jgi:hypothetical protein
VHRHCNPIATIRLGRRPPRWRGRTRLTCVPKMLLPLGRDRATLAVGDPTPYANPRQANQPMKVNRKRVLLRLSVVTRVPRAPL